MIESMIFFRQNETKDGPLLVEASQKWERIESERMLEAGKRLLDYAFTAKDELHIQAIEVSFEGLKMRCAVSTAQEPEAVKKLMEEKLHHYTRSEPTPRSAPFADSPST